MPADPGHEGTDPMVTTPVDRTRGREPTIGQRAVDAQHSATRAPAERGNSLHGTTSKAIRQVRHRSRRLGAITAAAPVLLHHEHDRTT